MAKKQDAGKPAFNAGGRQRQGVLPDMEWMRKRRDDVPVIEWPEPIENPFLNLLKSNESRRPNIRNGGNSGDDQSRKAD